MRTTLSKTDSLVQVVSNMLQDRDPAAASRFETKFSQRPDNQHDELIELNRFWRGELASLPVSTISERECLIDLIDPKDWVHHFGQQVMPTVVRFGLPNV
jgi:hypothetical protein